MDGTSQAAVTPQGVRDGDPAVLAALIARRGPAVLAFCEAVCDHDMVSEAVAEAFARFRALVATVGDAGSSDPEAFLLGATRHAAASMARTPTDSRGVLRSLGRGTSQETYAAVPALLAARADSMLGGEDLERLSRLLERSAGCREVEAAFRRAERGYKSPPNRPLGDERSRLVLAAMQAAAPIAPQFAAAYAPVPVPVPVPVPLDGASADGASADGASARDGRPVLPRASFAFPVLREDAPAAPEPFPGDAPQPAAAEPQTEPAPEPDPEPEPEPEPSDHGVTDVHQVLVPAGDPALADLEAGALDPPPKLYRARRTMPRVSLPDGGGLRLPRRPAQAPQEHEAAPAVDHGLVFRLLLPAVAILVAVLVMLAIAGVFGGGDPAPAAVVSPAVARQLPPDAAATATTTTARVSVPTPAPKAPRRPAAKRRAKHHSVRRTSGASRTSARTATAPPVTPPAPVTPAPTVRRPAATTPAPAPPTTPKSSPTAGKQSGSGAVPGGSGGSGSSDDDGYVPYDPSVQPQYP